MSKVIYMLKMYEYIKSFDTQTLNNIIFLIYTK